MATADSMPPPATERYGEVFDRGYAHYTGDRLGRRQAVRSLMLYSMKRAMGIRKSWTAKILPILLYVSAIVPLIIFIGLSAIVPDIEFATYSGYMSAIFLVVGIFVATTAPEMLCVDRRERTLPLYFSRAITRLDYVIAKVIAMTLLTMTLSVIPSVLLWLGQQLVSDAPMTAMRDNIGDLGRVLLIGTLIALVLGTGGLAISSLTDRKAVAVTVIIIGFIILTAIGNSGWELLNEEEWARYFVFLSLSDSFLGFSDHLFDDVTPQFATDANIPLWGYLAFFAAVVATSLLILRWRYRPTDDA
ncbi:MAG TPA: ABC transporter permease [Thermomicrobiales bacterium]|nr:ABC transporter permease [Thermomicrobiales bacterium]